MKHRQVLSVVTGILLTAAGCLHPPYGRQNNNTSFIPPMSMLVGRNNLPPAEMLMGPGPGVGGPGPGVLMGEPMVPFPTQASQISFVGPDGITVNWDVGFPGAFDSEPLVAPGRHNFPQGAIYRLKLTNIPGRPGVELYPTLEVGPSTPRTEAYLAHNAVPMQLTEEDFDQILSGNFVTKVIYLPDPEFQELAIAGVETLVSTRLDPGVDPIVEADRRGAILAIVRVGNKDLEIPDGEVMGDDGMALAGYASGGSNPPPFVTGVTAPQYGMPMSGTPIGLPGPPHVPLGVPAGLQKHVVTNHTKHHIPPPTKSLKIHVKQEPGLSYPKSPSHVFIKEQSHMPPVLFKQPPGDKHEHVQDMSDPAL